MNDYFNQPGQPIRFPKCTYKMEIAVAERSESTIDGKKVRHQLDLGPFERQLKITGVDAGTMTVPVRGRVLGDVRFLSGAPDGKIDLGSSFPSTADRSSDVDLVAERPGLGLAISANETIPNFLKVKLEPLEPLDGLNHWRLRVTVPKGSLLGALPPDSVIVLTTTDPTPRKLRLPVRGMTYDSGGPRF
jgi:hypothetical protein